MNRLYFLVVAICMSFVLPARGQQCLEFQDAVAFAGKGNPEVLFAERGVDLAAADALAASSLWRPRVETFTSNALGDVGLAGAQIQNQFGLRATQRLYDFGKAKDQRSAAQASLTSAKFGLELAESELARSAAAFYTQALAARQRILASEDNIQYFQRQKDAIAELLEQGLATKSDFMEIEIQISNEKAEEQSATLAYQQAIIGLNALTRTDSTPCEINDYSKFLKEKLFPDADALTSRIFTHNLELKQISQQVDAKGFEVSLENKNRLPVISAQGVAAYAFEDNSDSWRLRDRLGLDVSVPLYAGSALTASRNKVMAERAQLSAERDLIIRELEQQAKTLIWQDLALQAQLMELDQAISSLKIQLKIVQAEMRQGVATIPRLVEVRRQYSLTLQRHSDTWQRFIFGRIEQAFLADTLINRDGN